MSYSDDELIENYSESLDVSVEFEYSESDDSSGDSEVYDSGWRREVFLFGSLSLADWQRSRFRISGRESFSVVVEFVRNVERASVIDRKPDSEYFNLVARFYRRGLLTARSP